MYSHPSGYTILIKHSGESSDARKLAICKNLMCQTAPGSRYVHWQPTNIGGQSKLEV